MNHLLTVVGRAGSIDVRQVVWTCDAIGLDGARVDTGADLPAPILKAPFPVIRDGDFVLGQATRSAAHRAACAGRRRVLDSLAGGRANRRLAS